MLFKQLACACLLESRRKLGQFSCTLEHLLKMLLPYRAVDRPTPKIMSFDSGGLRSDPETAAQPSAPEDSSSGLPGLTPELWISWARDACVPSAWRGLRLSSRKQSPSQCVEGNTRLKVLPLQGKVAMPFRGLNQCLKDVCLSSPLGGSASCPQHPWDR